jgi:CHAT domain-containing protein
VVSSLWEAEDEGAAAFMEDFHGQTSHGVEVAEALRVAQLGMLRRSPSPYSHARIWGAFRLEHGQPLPLESNH